MSASEAIVVIYSSAQPSRWSPGNISKNQLNESPQRTGRPRGEFVQSGEKLGCIHEGNTGAGPKSFRKNGGTRTDKRFENSTGLRNSPGLRRGRSTLLAMASRSYKSGVKEPNLLGTRRSLVERLADWGDQLRWQEFFDTY